MPRNNTNRFTRRDAVKGAAAAGVIGLAGCLTGDNGLVDENRFIRTFESDIADRFVYNIVDADSGDAADLFLDGAYDINQDDEFVGRLVEDYETDDYQTWTFYLQDNLEWSDDYGDVTAEDFVFHINEVVTHPDNWAAHASTSGWFVDGEPAVADVVDDTTFTVELPRPDDRWHLRPGLWGEHILPKDLVEPYYEDWQDGDEDAASNLAESDEVLEFQFVGNLGAYEFEEYRTEDRIIGTRNEDYYMQEEGGDWDGAPYFDTYEIHVLEEQSTRLGELETEGVSWVDLPADEVDRFDDMDEIHVAQNATPYLRVLPYNQRDNGWEEFRTKEVRQAFSYVVDKEVIADNIFHGYIDTAHTYQPEWSDFYDDGGVSEFGEGDSYDPDTARDLLEDYTSTDYGYNGDGEFVDGDGEQVELTFLNRRGQEPVEDSGEYMADQYEEELGVSINLESQPADVMQEEYWMVTDDDGEPLGFNPGAMPDVDGAGREMTSERSWDFAWGFGFNSYPRTPSATDTFWTTTGQTNFYGYESEEIDGMFAQGADIEDDDDRQDLFGDLFATLSEDQPVNFIGFDQYNWGFLEAVEHTEDERTDAIGFGYMQNTWEYR